MILKCDEFFLDKLSERFPDTKPLVEPITEPVGETTFTVTQLEKITDILFDLAPSGFIAERTMVFLLQDLLAKSDNQYNQQVPLLWSKLSSENINELSEEIFGKMEYVPWKDFITQNLLLTSYPSMNELLQLRKNFVEYDPELTETVNDDYETIKFCFQRSALENLSEEALKLLSRLYLCKENHFNYTALLIDLCKGKCIVF